MCATTNFIIVYMEILQQTSLDCLYKQVIHLNMNEYGLGQP